MSSWGLNPTGKLSGLCNPKLESLGLSLLFMAEGLVLKGGGGGGCLAMCSENGNKHKFHKKTCQIRFVWNRVRKKKINFSVGDGCYRKTKIKHLTRKSQYAEKILNKILKYINKTNAEWKSMHQRYIMQFAGYPRLNDIESTW